MIMTTRRIDLFSISLANLECIVSTRLKGITWLTRHLSALADCGKTFSASQNSNGQQSLDKRNPPLRDAQNVQTSHPPNPGGYFTRPP